MVVDGIVDCMFPPSCLGCDDYCCCHSLLLLGFGSCFLYPLHGVLYGGIVDCYYPLPYSWFWVLFGACFDGCFTLRFGAVFRAVEWCLFPLFSPPFVISILDVYFAVIECCFHPFIWLVFLIMVGGFWGLIFTFGVST